MVCSFVLELKATDKKCEIKQFDSVQIINIRSMVIFYTCYKNHCFCTTFIQSICISNGLNLLSAKLSAKHCEISEIKVFAFLISQSLAQRFS